MAKVRPLGERLAGVKEALARGAPSAPGDRSPPAPNGSGDDDAGGGRRGSFGLFGRKSAKSTPPAPGAAALAPTTSAVAEPCWAVDGPAAAPQPTAAAAAFALVVPPATGTNKALFDLFDMPTPPPPRPAFDAFGGAFDAPAAAAPAAAPAAADGFGGFGFGDAWDAPAPAEGFGGGFGFGQAWGAPATQPTWALEPATAAPAAYAPAAPAAASQALPPPPTRAPPLPPPPPPMEPPGGYFAAVPRDAPAFQPPQGALFGAFGGLDTFGDFAHSAAGHAAPGFGFLALPPPEYAPAAVAGPSALGPAPRGFSAFDDLPAIPAVAVPMAPEAEPEGNPFDMF
jgi:hypothetical protein